MKRALYFAALIVMPFGFFVLAAIVAHYLFHRLGLGGNETGDLVMFDVAHV